MRVVLDLELILLTLGVRWRGYTLDGMPVHHSPCIHTHSYPLSQTGVFLCRQSTNRQGRKPENQEETLAVMATVRVWSSVFGLNHANARCFWLRVKKDNTPLDFLADFSLPERLVSKALQSSFGICNVTKSNRKGKF
ncbi:hypothetical protein PHYPO_G00164600 [Pangasianodon hypophthalmus]|uniref:Uncharacterized protein n=1 Tax=Pangasianodon hypophthalmus TaxID=310915 RepID=A0A5N5JGR5_PANHP|nr:hypothetical protein PHYPO_G00164600 [Pangasianodon hypophthalmus]